MESLRFAAWFTVHIIVPIFAPVALLPLLRLGVTFRRSARGIVSGALRDGQLFWVVITMCAEAGYELAGFFEHATPVGRAFAWAGLFAVITISILSSALLLVGAIDSLDEGARQRAGIRSKIMQLSVGATAVVSILFSVIHLLAQ